jgi:hypothetical protein
MMFIDQVQCVYEKYRSHHKQEIRSIEEWNVQMKSKTHSEDGERPLSKVHSTILYG